MRRWSPLVLLLAALAACDNSTEPVPEYQASLSGASVIPPVTTQATGIANFRIEGSAITYDVSATNITGVTSVSLHTGDATTQGPVVISLFDQPAGTGAIDGSFAAGSFAESGLTGITMPALIAAFDNSNAYVLVETLAHPNGELRGQVQRAIAP